MIDYKSYNSTLLDIVQSIIIMIILHQWHWMIQCCTMVLLLLM